MPTPAFKNTKNITLIVVALAFGSLSFCSAQEGPADLFSGTCYIKKTKNTQKAEETVSNNDAAKQALPQKTKDAGKNKAKRASAQDENLSLMQKQARQYRAEGLQAQQRGDLASAMNCYQKAVTYDPGYAVLYNDLGIIYETRGENDRAEASYLKAVKTDPKNLSAYSNLALFYENKRDLKSASHYWQKRGELGEPDDPWTMKANARYEDICLSLGLIPVDSREQEVVQLVQDISAKKSLYREDNKELAKDYFERAKVYFQKGNNTLALKSALDARELNPTDKDITDFIEKVQKRLLLK